ncbi:MAG: glycoside hydrolase family 3 C-terminal domain-containing protein [Anaerolineales bacterium]|nr:glycoside hydrolase family 3 C-terminal domain-containing protein [Anaerolineales bacterium]
MKKDSNRLYEGYTLGIVLLAVIVGLAACQTETATLAPVLLPTAEPATESTEISIITYLDSSAPIEARVEDLLARMTLEEKVGQMTQIEKGSLQEGMVARYFLGSVLSGGGGYPMGDNTVEGWAEMVNTFQAEALSTRLGIPIIYGVDAVHGHNNLYGATIFPHNIGLGAANDADLMERIGRTTAIEMAATGIRWNFAPVVAVVQDIRWGRTYESYSENTEVVTNLATAYLRGLQGENPDDPLSALATPKHFLGDGGTVYGSSTTINMKPYILDQGDMQVDEAGMRSLFLPPYAAAVDAGALSVMASFSSWNGVKMHANAYLLTDVLKGELGFQGFIVSDWGGIDQIDKDYYQAVVTAINAGVDMNMVPYDAAAFIGTVTKAVESGDISMERIDDAVRRILYAKFAMGLFEKPYPDPALASQVGSDEHRALAREAVAKSLVLLQNNNQALPISHETPLIFVGGDLADDLGAQCGGWTIEWQGKSGQITIGDTIVDAIKANVAEGTTVHYNRFGKFDNAKDESGNLLIADVGIAVVGEMPYAEGIGDATNLSLAEAQVSMLERMRERSRTLIVIIISGRPLIITEQMDLADAWIAAWLPGTEAQGITDVLFGDLPFTGRLAFTWPRGMDQLPFDFTNLPTGENAPLFPFGYGGE